MGNVVRKLVNNKRLLWAGGSMIGACGTAYLSALGQRKADMALAEHEGEELTFKDKFKLTWKYYILPAGALGVTLVCSGMQYNLGTKEIAALSGSVAILAANKNKIEEAVKEKYGEEALAEIKKAVSFPEKKEIVVPENSKSKRKVPHIALCPEDTGHGDEIFIEEGLGRVFKSSRTAVINGLGCFNGELLNLDGDGEGVGSLSYNDLYCFLDLDETDNGENYIWYKDHTGTNFGEHGVEFVLSEPEYVERYDSIVTWIRNYKHPPYCCYDF